MGFILYDLIFLIAFAIFVSVFLYTRKRNLKKEGLLFLYKAGWGIKLIDSVGKKYQKTLKFLGYISIAVGYFLMASMIYLFGKIVYLYIAFPSVSKAIKVPPIIPLFPYLPSAFKLDFLPPFYFTYWIIILAIVAITHEFAHGIFAARDNIKIKSTGFGFFPFFLPVFLAAFVEPDEKVMSKRSKFTQLSVLSAGTFANVITAIIGFLLLWGFFSLSFAPAGVTFDSYAFAPVPISQIHSINGNLIDNASLNDLKAIVDSEGLYNLTTKNNQTFFITKSFLTAQRNTNEYIFAYYNAPAILNGITGPIISIDGKKIKSVNELGKTLDSHKPGDIVSIGFLSSEGVYLERNLVLGAHPDNISRPWIGISYYDRSKSGISGKVYSLLKSFKKPNVYYVPRAGEFSWFIYNLLWWLVLISASIALVNMLPVGIFDGGRFFYLTVWGLTKNEKFARKAFTFTTYFILFLVLVLMFFWAIGLF